MPLALIYPDTTTWNALCDQDVDAESLTVELAARQARLVLGTNAVYEIAKTFKGTRSGTAERGKQLFTYLSRYVQLTIPLLRQTDDLLREEVRHVTKQTQDLGLFYDGANYEKLMLEVSKLAQGIFDSRAAHFIPERQADAKKSREELYAHIDQRPHLKQKLAAILDAGIDNWIRQALKEHAARRMLSGHLAAVLAESSLKDLTRIAKRLLASPQYRVAHAMVRSDLYLNWRYCRRGSLGKDMPDDNYHIVNASYCEAFVTSDPELVAYAKHVLKQTGVFLYSRDVPVLTWLKNIAAEL
jgi:hypothetical protein